MTRHTAHRLALLGLILTTTVAATPSDLNEAGKAAYAKGDFAAAERLFREALAQAPDEPLLHYHRGVALMRLARWPEASMAFETALRLNPPREVALAARQGLQSLAPLLHTPAGRPAVHEESAVSLRRLGGNWFAQVRVNNMRSVQFLVDTGAATCVISPELAAQLDIRPDQRVGPVPLRTLSGVTSGRVVTISLLRVGETEAEDVLAVVHPVGPNMDGILGNTFLSRFTVTLDPERGILRLGTR